jgi:cytochrome c oxidase cbb3-type subunit 3
MHPFLKKLTLSTITLAIGTLAFANDTATQVADTDFILDVNSVLMGCAGLLFIVILSLGATLRSAILYYHQRRKTESKNNTGNIVSAMILFFLLLSTPVLAQDSAAVVAQDNTIPESEVIRWMLYIVLGIEILIIFLFARLIRFFTGVEAFRREAHRSKASVFNLAGFWTRINKFKPIEEEASLDTGHSYDGIRELNNVTPPWFIAGFVLSILFGCIYMWRYHVSKTAPLQVEEYNIAVAEAKERVDAYLKTQANNVDENTVAVLGADGIAAGQALFASNCVACHGDKGQGASVGPNLSDNYWLHKGSIKDKSIKYGWQEKGMKSWKEDFSPNQIAQLASYVYSLRGTNPAGAKEPQGELYEEAAAAVVKDSATH